jgi:protoporphyrinogen oxidase
LGIATHKEPESRGGFEGYALGSDDKITTLIRQFHYPRLGPGMMWERVAEVLKRRGVPIHLCRKVTKVHLAEGMVTAVTAVDEKGEEMSVAGEHFISSMPLREVIAAMNPAPPQSVIEASQQLHYRDFLMVGLIVNKREYLRTIGSISIHQMSKSAGSRISRIGVVQWCQIQHTRLLVWNISCSRGTSCGTPMTNYS